MWQERQKAVLSERVISFCMPAARQNSGKKKSTQNARIFPARLTVVAGRTTITPASTALNTTRITMAMVGITSVDSDALLLKSSYKRDEILDLLGFQALSVSWHLAFSVADDPRELLIRLLLHVGGAQIPNLVRLAHAGFAFAIRSVAYRAFRFVQCVPTRLRTYRYRRNAQDCAKQKSRNPSARTISPPDHISSRNR